MSFSIPFSQFTEEIKEHISNQCIMKPASSLYVTEPEPVYCFEVDTAREKIHIPMGVWPTLYDRFPTTKQLASLISNKKEYIMKKKPFTIETDPKHYRDQDVVFAESIEILKRNGALFLGLPTGFGKTTMGILLACYFGLKTVVTCHLDLVNSRWLEDFSKETNCKVQHVKGKTLDPDADVYIIGVKKLSMMDRDLFNDIGTVIFDEAHIATITAFTSSLLKFNPRYLIGLSATPKRADGMHKLFEIYFGGKENFILRKETKNFTVYKVETSFVPQISYTLVRGQSTIDWNCIVNSLAFNEERQDLAVEIATSDENKDKYIMILSDRKEQSEAVYKKLIGKGEHVALLIGTTKKWDKTCRILVAGTKKAGVGFDDPRLNMLILLSDTKQVAQFEGRLRTIDSVIYDFVDYYKTLETHWRIREKWFLERGATIEVISMGGRMCDTVSLLSGDETQYKRILPLQK